MEAEKLKSERLFEQRLERLMEERRASVEGASKSTRNLTDRNRQSIELNLSKIEELSKPKRRPSIDRSHIRRGSSLLEHKLSLPHIRASSNAEDLMEKLGSPPPIERTKRLQHLKTISQASVPAVSNSKLELLRDMNILLRGPSHKSVTQIHRKDASDLSNFADGHIHRY